MLPACDGSHIDLSAFGNASCCSAIILKSDCGATWTRQKTRRVADSASTSTKNQTNSFPAILSFAPSGSAGFCIIIITKLREQEAAGLSNQRPLCVFTFSHGSLLLPIRRGILRTSVNIENPHENQWRLAFG